MMQVHRRWLKLALVAVALMHSVADAQVYTMESNLNGYSDSTSDSGSELVISHTPTPTARTPSRTWIPITDAPSDSSETSETPSRTTATPRVTKKAPRSTTRTPTATTKTPRATTKAPRVTTRAPSTDASESASTYEGTLNSESASDAGATEESSVVESSAESGSSSELESTADSKSTAESGSEDTASTQSSGSSKATTKKKKKTVFTKSPYLEQTTPVPNGIHTADEDSNSDESASASPAGSESESKSDESGSSSKSKTKKPRTKKKSSNSDSGSDSSPASSASSKASNSTKKNSSSSGSTKQGSSSKTSGTDSTQNSSSTPSPASSTTSASASSSSASASASAASVMTDSASSGKTGLSSTVTLVLIMGGVVALVVVIAVFVYIRTAEKDAEDDDDIDPVLRTARHDGSKGAAQSSTLAANYHGNDNMSPMSYSDDDYYPNHHQNGQYDQEPYGYHRDQGSRGNSGTSVNYNDPNLDVLTPQSQIALAHSQMSLPPMAQTGHTNDSSQFSGFSTESSFYANSAYSANPSSASQVVSKYPGMRKGKEENDVAGSDEEESDFEGDSIQDMSHATNEWKSAGRRPERNLGDTGVSGMDQSVAESRFEPGDSRSTAASGRSTGYNGKKEFMQSEYTEYRMSTDYESSNAASKRSGYDSRYAGGKSFQSSGFSEYENAAPPRNRGDSGNSDASSYYQGKQSRFTDASYY